MYVAFVVSFVMSIAAVFVFLSLLSAEHIQKREKVALVVALASITLCLSSITIYFGVQIYAGF